MGFASERLPNTSLSKLDQEIELTMWGFTAAFLYLTAWKAWKRTRKMRRSRENTSVSSSLGSTGKTRGHGRRWIWWIWFEITANFSLGLLAFLLFNEYIPQYPPVLFSLIFFWGCEIQALPQIILNRLSIVVTDKRRMRILRQGIFVLGMLEILVAAALWIPARLESSKTWTAAGHTYQVVDKFAYLLLDCALNYYFIKTCKQELVRQGLTKYDRLVKFNTRIILLSISMDLLIIGMMYYPNHYIFLQVHPLAFSVKLNIELNMVTLIANIARGRNNYSSQWEVEFRELSSERRALEIPRPLEDIHLNDAFCEEGRIKSFIKQEGVAEEAREDRIRPRPDNGGSALV